LFPRYGVDRRDLGQPVQQGLVDGVPREEDALDAVEHLRQERIEAGMEVSHEAETHPLLPSQPCRLGIRMRPGMNARGTAGVFFCRGRLPPAAVRPLGTVHATRQ